MTTHDPDPLDLTAAEFALGTLRGAPAERLAERLRTDPDLARRVREWEERLAPLAERYAPADAPETVWDAVEQRLFAIGRGASEPRVTSRFWQRLAAGLGSMATVLLAAVGYLVTSNEAPQCYAVLTDELDRPAVVVFDRRNMRELVVLPVGTRLHDGQGTAQLWIVTGGKATPAGILNADGETRLALAKPMLTAVMASDARLLVTLEPPGDSPTGQPRGRRVAEGIVALLGAPSPAPKPL